MRISVHIAIVLTALAIQALLFAKRVPPEPVNPAVRNNIEYSADGDGRDGYVVATDMRTNKELWKVKVFHVHLKPWLEEDVQWVFIKQLELTDDALSIRDEKAHCYRLNLSTRQIKKTRCP